MKISIALAFGLILNTVSLGQRTNTPTDVELSLKLFSSSGAVGKIVGSHLLWMHTLEGVRSVLGKPDLQYAQNGTMVWRYSVPIEVYVDLAWSWHTQNNEGLMPVISAILFCFDADSKTTLTWDLIPGKMGVSHFAHSTDLKPK